MLYHSVHLAMAADMIKKILLSLVSVVLIAGAGIYLFKAPLWEMAQEKLTADMFVSADNDSFDPGLAVGDTFPAIKATYQGQQIADVSAFVHDKGMVFIANRSADW